MGSTQQLHTFSSASPFGTQTLGKGPSSSSLIPTILGGLGSAFLGPAGPILGSLAGTALNFGINRIESGIQNRYNSPKNQIKRLAQAGLPGAAYFDKQQQPSAGSTGTYAQPDLGTAEAISREQVNRMQKQQFELMKREMAVKEQEVQLKKQQTDKLFQDTRYGTTKADYYSQPGTFAKQIEVRNKLAENQAEVAGIKAEADRMANEVYAEFKKEGGQLNILRGVLKGQQSTRNSQASQRAVNVQSIKESAARMAKMMVDIEATKAQMSLAQQLEKQRQLKGEILANMQDDLNNGTGGMAWLGAMLLRIAGL